MAFEPVHCILDWYDGPRKGIAKVQGLYHFFESCWSNIDSDAEDMFLLVPISHETFCAALEDWEIWLRWEQAYKSGMVTVVSHPALPEDRQRHEVLSAILKRELVIDEGNRIAATVEFRYNSSKQPKTEAEWTLVDYDPSSDQRSKYGWDIE